MSQYHEKYHVQSNSSSNRLAFSIRARRFVVLSAFHSSLRCCRFNEKSAVFPTTVGSEDQVGNIVVKIDPLIVPDLYHAQIANCPEAVALVCHKVFRSKVKLGLAEWGQLLLQLRPLHRVQ